MPDDELGKKEEMWKPHVHQPLDSCLMLDTHTHALAKMHPYLCAGFDRYTDAGIN